MLPKDQVSPAVIRRLPRYYRHLEELESLGVERISSRLLAQRMGLTASQIRQDLNCFGGFGQQGYGYNVANLRQEIASILGLTQVEKAIMLGVGNMGRALMHNFSFARRGFALEAAFDVDRELIGKEINGVPVYDVKDVEEYVRQNHPAIAVLTLPRVAAREMADRLVAAGIRGLWNFTNNDLNVYGDGVMVENVHFGDSLMMLHYRLRSPREH